MPKNVIGTLKSDLTLTIPAGTQVGEDSAGRAFVGVYGLLGNVTGNLFGIDRDLVVTSKAASSTKGAKSTPAESSPDIQAMIAAAVAEALKAKK